MTVYQLIPDLPLFPPVEEAEVDGLLAIGGDLSVERLLEAYRLGIFPWYEDGQPILWWSPDPRLIMIPNEFKNSRSLKKIIRQKQFDVRFDSAFSQVINKCAEVRRQKDEGTWITSEMQNAYIALHHEGFAHSIESWQDGKLVGGLYGISLGKCFFGESMFSICSNASKVALSALAIFSSQNGIEMIDCQMTTPHLVSMGAKEISRKLFTEKLKILQAQPTLLGSWNSSSYLKTTL